MVKYCYIVTEGPQDIEFLICLLKSYGLKRVTRFSSLDSFWKPLVPSAFPVDDDLRKRVPVPVFLQNADLSVALHSAIGITRLSETIEENLALIPASKFFGIGVFLDADDSETPQERFEKLISELSPRGLLLPSVLGEVMKDSPRCGIFIAPNNSAPGTLEDILIECAKVNYPNLLALSTKYVADIDTNQLTKDDLKELNKPAGKNKVVISSISSILRPGKTLQVSIQDNRWIDEKTMTLNTIKRVQEFLEQVMGLV
ncbi:DUF4276 domain-containing protein [Tumidithrix helvetica PCC 7403]|uniref:DUF3226 domain-containing protein n=1 Tax=Tumidithrix helvetica TaxID=3457545 RepID=UPI003CC269ED